MGLHQIRGMKNLNKPGGLSQIEQLIRPILDEQNYELVAVEFGKEPQGKTLRIFIDSDRGVTISDCALVSEHLGAVLDEKNLIKEHYILEVSSPGIERPLVKKQDFAKYRGSKIHVKVFAPIDDRKRFTGILKSAGKDRFSIDCEGKVLSIPYQSVAKAHLVVDDVFS